MWAGSAVHGEKKDLAVGENFNPLHPPSPYIRCFSR